MGFIDYSCFGNAQGGEAFSGGGVGVVPCAVGGVGGEVEQVVPAELEEGLRMAAGPPVRAAAKRSAWYSLCRGAARPGGRDAGASRGRNGLPADELPGLSLPFGHSLQGPGHR